MGGGGGGWRNDQGRVYVGGRERGLAEAVCEDYVGFSWINVKVFCLG